MRVALGALLAVIVFGTVGYIVLGFTPLEAMYQTVTTVATVGFREVRPLSAAGMVFTMVLILPRWAPSSTTSASSWSPSPRATCANTSKGVAWTSGSQA